MNDKANVNDNARNVNETSGTYESLNSNDNAHDYVLRVNNISETHPEEVAKICEEAKSQGVTLGDFINSRTGLNRAAKPLVRRAFGKNEDDTEVTSPEDSRTGQDFTRTTVVGDGQDSVNVQDPAFSTRPKGESEPNRTVETRGDTDNGDEPEGSDDGDDSDDSDESESNVRRDA
jgi:hypothetical protein